MSNSPAPLHRKVEQVFRRANGTSARMWSLRELSTHLGKQVSRLPFCSCILMENLLRNGATDEEVTSYVVYSLSASGEHASAVPSFEFYPGRVLHTDATGIPALLDLAAMRDKVAALGLDAGSVDSKVPSDLVVDHSIQVNSYGQPDSLTINRQLEFARNRERFAFLKWAESAFDNLRVAPPGVGIVHQVNLEYLARLIQFDVERGAETDVFPDTMVGTDSHSTMINGLGVVGWGVGGIEAEAVMLGQPYVMQVPKVVGVRLTGALTNAATATDLVLRITELLRKHGVVGQFVEFFGPGLETLSVPHRATVANMAPEYGATMGYFPVDSRTLEYMELSGRGGQHAKDILHYFEQQGLMYKSDSVAPSYAETLELSLTSIEPSLAGPLRPQDRLSLSEVKPDYLSRREHDRVDVAPVSTPSDGSVVLAAITSCTNTSNPSLMVGAGLLAKRAVEAGLEVQPWIKTSLAPGSQVVTDYLARAGLTGPLEQLGFSVVGFGCTTCIGNSGDLAPEVMKLIDQGAAQDQDFVAVLSGNRNFQGRANKYTSLNYLASPALVVAYALAGRIDIDLTTEPVGTSSAGERVFLRDLWPESDEINDVVEASVRQSDFTDRYSRAFEGDEQWDALPFDGGAQYAWDPTSTYFQRPIVLDGFSDESGPLEEVFRIADARALATLGDSVTTDDIIPAGGRISPDSPAGQWLTAHGADPHDLNSYTSRRGAHDVQLRGMFSNSFLPNSIEPGLPPASTIHTPSGSVGPYFEIAQMYADDNTPIVLFAGERYGTGSSRDWAAKGTALLGIRAVVAQSFERIHRSNLIGCGVLPLAFKPGENLGSLGLTGRESFSFMSSEPLTPGGVLTVMASEREGLPDIEFTVDVRIDNHRELEYFQDGGIVPAITRQIIRRR